MGVAAAVIVTCNRDDTATLITLTARELNPDATIVAAVKDSENAHLLRESGAHRASSSRPSRPAGSSAWPPSSRGRWKFSRT